MTITLPDEMKDELERKARTAGFTSVDQFVLHTLQDCSDDYAEDLRDMPVPEALEIESREDLEAKILEGLNSGPAIRVTALTPRSREELEAMLDEGMKSGGIVEADEAFWAERRRILLEKFSHKSETKP